MNLTYVLDALTQMYVQSLYFDVKRPEDQFVEYIIRKKVILPPLVLEGIE